MSHNDRTEPQNGVMAPTSQIHQEAAVRAATGDYGAFHECTLTCPDCGWSVRHACDGPATKIVKPDTEAPSPQTDGDKVMSVKRSVRHALSSRAHAQEVTIPVRDSNSPDTGVTPVVSTPESTGDPEEDVVYYTHVEKRRDGTSHFSGSGSKSGRSKTLSRRRDNSAESVEQLGFMPPTLPTTTEPPERLKEFVGLLGRSDKFKPTESYYRRMMMKFANVPYLDFTEQAEAMIEWLRNHPKRYHELKDLCRFSERWMAIAADEAAKIARANGMYRNGKPNQRPGDTLRMGGGLSDDQLASADEMSRRGRAHYDE